MRTKVTRAAIDAMAEYVLHYQTTPRHHRRERDDKIGLRLWSQAIAEVRQANPSADGDVFKRALRRGAIKGSIRAVDTILASPQWPVPLRMPPRFRQLFTDDEWREAIIGRSVVSPASFTRAHDEYWRAPA